MQKTHKRGRKQIYNRYYNTYKEHYGLEPQGLEPIALIRAYSKNHTRLQLREETAIRTKVTGPTSSNPEPSKIKLKIKSRQNEKVN